MMRANPERPVPFQGDLRNLPVALEPLKALPNWVCWKFVWKVDRKGVGSWTKPPYQPNSPTRYAKNNNPATWGTYEQALAAFAAGQCDGIGFNLSGTGIAAFDLDECRDRATGAIAPEAMKIVDRAASYTEMTPSGTGLRVVGYGIGAKTHRKQKISESPVEIESYRGAERYITVTGNPLPGILDKWPHMVDIGDVIDAVVAELDGHQVLPFDGCKDEAQQNLDEQANAESASADTGDALLPGNLVELIEKGVAPQDDWSAAFHRAVCWLADCGWSAERIERRIAGQPIVPERFARRLRGEVERCLRKAETKANETASQSSGEESATAAELEILRLAKLPAIKYEQERIDAAKALNFRASMLDRLVQAERARLGFDDDDAGLQGRAISFPEPEPWPEPVEGAALLDEIAATLKRYVIMDEQARYSTALWITHTYLLDAFMISPRLAVRSPMKRCGKTTLLDVLGCLVMKALPTANVSAAAMFRVVEGYRPCLLVDEADTFLAESDDLRGVLNSGHRRGGSVLRTVGDDHEPRAFATYAAVAIGLIGALPDTLADRSIPIVLKRKLLSEVTESFRIDRVGHLEVLARKAARWAQDNAEAIAKADPEMPAGVHSRAADNWRPLVAIADAAGGEWPKRARAAASQAAAETETESMTELLLGDVRDIFARRAENKVEPADRISSVDLVAALVGIEGRPWAEMGKARKPITQNRLARLLKPLAVASQQIRFADDDTRKGYYLHQFEEAFARYLTPEGASQPKQRNKADEMGTSDLFQSETDETDVSVRKCEKPNNDGPCFGVSDEKGDSGDARSLCAYCGLHGGNEVAVSGRTVRLHRDCEDPYWRLLEQGHGSDSSAGLLDNVAFFGVEPFDPCDHCGKTDGVVHHVRFNRHPGRPSLNLHEACIESWLAAHDEDAD